MAFGQNTTTGIGGAVNDIFSSEATASSLRLRGQGDLVEAQNYDAAAVLAKQNENFTEQSTAVKQAMTDRQLYLSTGTEQATIAAGGFQQSGSALDILRSNAQQGALQKQLIGQQGLIQEAGFNEQASAYTNLANFARYSAGVSNDQADNAELAGEISAGFKAATAVASVFL